MKILFVHYGREHLGLEYMSSILKQTGHETELACDIGFFSRNDNIFHSSRLEKVFRLSRSVVKKAAEYKPGLVCFTAYTSTLQWCFEIAAEIKRATGAVTVIGGPHVTLAPESALLCPDMDYGVRGECETMLAGLADAIQSRRSPLALPGLIYRDNGGIKINPVPELVEDLDLLPLPDKKLFERTVSISNDYMTITGRGCIYGCTYCCEHAFRRNYPGRRYRRVRSVDSLLEELNTMHARYGFREVYFVCPLFPPEKKWVAEFVERYSKEIKKPFYCFGHINFFDREYAQLLRAAGCRDIEFGIQTLNEDIRRGTLKRNETNEKLEEVLSICAAVGLHVDMDTILGLPGEKEGRAKAASR